MNPEFPLLFEIEKKEYKGMYGIGQHKYEYPDRRNRINNKPNLGYLFENVKKCLISYKFENINNYCEMNYNYSDINREKKKFVLSTENPDDFEVILIGDEITSPWAKAALLHNGKIIFRSSTSTINKKNKLTHNDRWYVCGRLFYADPSFWKKLKEEL